jgi:hypothetical protein
MIPRFSNHRDGSGSLAFPAPSSTFRRCRPGPRGVPFLAAAPTEAGADDPHDLGLPFEALARALVPPRGRSSSREIRAPLHRHHLRASTPGSKLPSARLCDLSSSFRPRGFAPPRRLAPHTGSRVCCTPQPVRGSPRFRRRRSRSRPKTVADLRAPSPRRGFTPFEECPRRQPEPHHCGPLPSCRCRRSPDRTTRPKPHDARSVPANREPRGLRTGRSRSGNPLTWAVVSPR